MLRLLMVTAILVLQGRGPLQIEGGVATGQLLAPNGTPAAGIRVTARAASAQDPDWKVKQDREREADALGKRNLDPPKTVHTEVEAANAAVAAYRERMQKAQFARFRAALVQFLDAHEELSEALGSKAKIKEPARKMEKSTGVFLDFVERQIGQRPRPVSAKIEDLAPTELGRAVLTSAGRLIPDLLAVVQSEKSPTVDVGFLMSFPKLQAELLRLQEMTRKLK